MVELTRQKQTTINLNCFEEITNKNKRTNDKRLNLTDLWYLLLRSSKNSIIRGWKFEFMKALCLFSGVLFVLILYPNHIGLDPSCPIDITTDVNISEITDRVYDFVNGKKKDAELNVNYLVTLVFYFGFVYSISITLVFVNEIKVS